MIADREGTVRRAPKLMPSLYAGSYVVYRRVEVDILRIRYVLELRDEIRLGDGEHVNVGYDTHLVGKERGTPEPTPDGMDVRRNSGNWFQLQYAAVCRVDGDVMVLINVNQDRLNPEA
jgi:pSer/pThr/pTyr-binding forkhead associated (FHA) protein